MAAVLASEYVQRAEREGRARSTSLAVEHPRPGVIHLEGATRLDLLNRMSTNDLATLPAGTAAPTVLTTAVGKIVDYVWVLATDDALTLVTGPGRAHRVHDWLHRHTFFQDDIRLSIPPDEVTLWGVYGPRWADAVRSVATNLPAIGPGECRPVESGWAWGVEEPNQGGVRLLLSGDAARRARDAWVDPDARALYQALRIESGIPEHGSEIDDEVIPLEVGLRPAISFTKGCYIGQEIIARMDSRGRQAHQLVGVLLPSEIPPTTRLMQAEAAIGRLTSVAWSAKHGWIGLALARPAALSAADGRVALEGLHATARLVSLPFRSAASN